MLRRFTTSVPYKNIIASMQNLVSNLFKARGSRYLPLKHLQEERVIVDYTFVLEHVMRFVVE